MADEKYQLGKHPYEADEKYEQLYCPELRENALIHSLVFFRAHISNKERSIK